MSGETLFVMFQAIVCVVVGILIGSGYYYWTSIPGIRRLLAVRPHIFYSKAGLGLVLFNFPFIVVMGLFGGQFLANKFPESWLLFWVYFTMLYLFTSASCALSIMHFSWKELMQSRPKQPKLL